MSAVATLRGETPQQVRSLVSSLCITGSFLYSASLQPLQSQNKKTRGLFPGSSAVRHDFFAFLAPHISRRPCLAHHPSGERSKQDLADLCFFIVPPAFATGRAVYGVQLPRVCEATNEGCLPRAQGRAGLAQGPGAHPEGPKGAAEHEGTTTITRRSMKRGQEETNSFNCSAKQSLANSISLTD